jgi:iron-sulfur cluster assembly protein
MAMGHAQQATSLHEHAMLEEHTRTDERTADRQAMSGDKTTEDASTAEERSVREVIEATPVAAATIAISKNAADAIQQQRVKRGTPDAAIRVGIRGGGCTGFSYLFEWDDNKEPRASDKVFTAHGVVLYVDPKSFVYLRGTELDFVKSMMGHGFKFNNPNVKGACGCGESVQF